MLRRPMSPVWYLKRGPYVVFMLRELTSLFNALYMVFLLMMIHKVSQGPEAYGSFLSFLRSPGMVLLHVVAFGFSILHTVTWFNATGKAIVVRLGEERLPDAALALPNYALWVAVSASVLWVVVNGWTVVLG